MLIACVLLCPNFAASTPSLISREFVLSWIQPLFSPNEWSSKARCWWSYCWSPRLQTSVRSAVALQQLENPPARAMLNAGRFVFTSWQCHIKYLVTMTMSMFQGKQQQEEPQQKLCSSLASQCKGLPAEVRGRILIAIKSLGHTNEMYRDFLRCKCVVQVEVMTWVNPGLSGSCMLLTACLWCSLQQHCSLTLKCLLLWEPG